MKEKKKKGNVYRDICNPREEQSIDNICLL